MKDSALDIRMPVEMVDVIVLNIIIFLAILPFPAGIYLLKFNNRNTTTRCEICSKLIIKTTEQCQWHRSGVFIVNFEHISHLLLVFLLLTLNT